MIAEQEQKIGTERRRSQRIRLAIAVTITSLDPSLLFSGRCNTIDVSFHGCQFFVSRPFKHKTRLRLGIPGTQHTVTARVIHSIPAVPGMQVRLWKVGVEFDRPGNFWSIDAPPPDWVL